MATPVSTFFAGWEAVRLVQRIVASFATIASSAVSDETHSRLEKYCTCRGAKHQFISRDSPAWLCTVRYEVRRGARTSTLLSYSLGGVDIGPPGQDQNLPSPCPRLERLRA